jgi:hypothetical protein
MEERFRLKLDGPCTINSGILPELDDIVVTINDREKLEFHIVKRLVIDAEQFIVITSTGRELNADECYLSKSFIFLEKEFEAQRDRDVPFYFPTF